MLPLLVWLLPIVAIATYIARWYFRFRENLRKAQKSGLSYIILPVFNLSPLWLLTHKLLAKYVLQFLPAGWVEPWYTYSQLDFTWHLGYEAFRRRGTDTILAVSDGGLFLSTADADVIWQILNRRQDFPKPSKQYRALNIYGENVVSAPEDHWRRHRKFTSPPFNEKNNHLVWHESLEQMNKMFAVWTCDSKESGATVNRLMDDTMRFSLHIISRAGFGRKIEWPQQKDELETTAVKSHGRNAPSKIGNFQADIDEGHTMSYVYALHSLLHNIVWTFLLPPWLLSRFPFKPIRLAHEAFTEWGKYMNEMMQSKRLAMEEGKGMDDMDIMGQLLKGQMVGPNEMTSKKDLALTDTEIRGNAYVLIIAGHETVANSLHYAILLLALHPAKQRALQQDLESHFQGRPVSNWDYDQDVPALLSGMAGAVLSEQLRLIPPAINIPKSVDKSGDQVLTVEGKECTVPADTYINLCVPSVHRNPKYWPTSAPSTGAKVLSANRDDADDHDSSNLNDLDEFKPERWFVKTENAGNKSSDPSAPDQSTTHSCFSTFSPSHFQPPKGAYIPFSDGHRSCMGRRFAQVEMVAVLASIFTQYSVELAVDQYVPPPSSSDHKHEKGIKDEKPDEHYVDEVIDKMDMAGRKEVWDKAAHEAWRLIRESYTILTLQIRTGHVPIRIVPKGKEKFNFAE